MVIGDETGLGMDECKGYVVKVKDVLRSYKRDRRIQRKGILW